MEFYLTKFLRCSFAFSIRFGSCFQPTQDRVPSGFVTSFLFIAIPHLRHSRSVETLLLPWSKRISSTPGRHNARRRPIPGDGSVHVTTTDSPRSLHLCSPSSHNQFARALWLNSLPSRVTWRLGLKRMHVDAKV